ncbi:MAG: sigma-70 family RNA polymerase sigma factor [Phycisphaerales bacterium]|nr:sigma-70 family RNA polymerase sigma factor [Phycisphaerales bacterium]
MSRHSSKEPSPSAEQVFEVLTLQNAEPLLAFIRSMTRNEAMVDDVFQETMLIAWRRLEDYDRERPFGPWLRGIAHKVALAQFRKSGRERPIEASVVEALEQKIGRIEKHSVEGRHMPGDALKECVSRLPAAFRDAIELTYRGDRSVAHAASAADVGVEAMKKRLQRARAMLADCLRGKGVFA